MSTAINTLRREHANMRSVLILVRDQMELLETGRVPDFVLLANAIYYMRKFPSLVHHPKEDLIFERLVAADSSLKKDVEAAHKEHEEIYSMEDWLVENALDAPKPGTQKRARLLEFGRHYLEVQRHHSEREERLLFPRADELLKPSDWAEVSRRFKDIDDPLFGKHGGERFELLYDHLMREAADS
ncbi:MAG TPA: hemerythrin domain-containing protein [Gammaproteobacteria bacterium]|nr:hemerythrin domain-containing protein [Gammaproteobacteria bacterium]